jgi:hypothetical protein
MRQLETFEEKISAVLPDIPENERKKFEKSFELLKSAIILQERKYQQAIRDRAAVHSLLKKHRRTSSNATRPFLNIQGPRWS